MMAHIGFDRQSSPLSPPMVVRPPFCMGSDALAENHPPEEIIDTVFRVLCGYESVSEACLRKGIKPRQYYRWHENFVEICRKWSPKRFQVDRPAPPRTSAANGPATTTFFLTDEEIPLLSGAYLPEDIARWAQDRLSVAWRADYQSLRLAPT